MKIKFLQARNKIQYQNLSISVFLPLALTSRLCVEKQNNDKRQ